ncbi:MAG: hypothetical protein ACYDEX_09155 [Mobilitalea sp.]
MPWCPKCKTEYQNGYTVCSDCKVDLVEDIQEEEVLIPFFQSEEKKVADKLVRYFKFSNLDSEVSYNEENEVYVVSIPPKQEKQAKKLYQAFYFVERDLLEKEEAEPDATDSDDAPDKQSNISEDNQSEEAEMDSILSEADDDNELERLEDGDYIPEEEHTEETPGDDISGLEEANEDTSVYVMKADQYKDLAGTVLIFFFFGVAGLIFVLLNVVGVISFLNGFFPFTVMSALFLLFIYIAVSTNQKAKIVKTEIEKENKLTEQINQWLTLHVTESFLSSIHDDDSSSELNYIKTIDTIKEMLLKEFGVQNLAYLDRLIEEYYNRTFDHY